MIVNNILHKLPFPPGYAILSPSEKRINKEEEGNSDVRKTKEEKCEENDSAGNHPSGDRAGGDRN